jgi:hypothetical protein
MSKFFSIKEDSDNDPDNNFDYKSDYEDVIDKGEDQKMTAICQQNYK